MRSRGRTSISLVVCAVIALTLGFARPHLAAAADVSRITAAISERATYGLRTDEAFVASLLDSSSDVGSRRYGIAASQAELDALDLPARAASVTRAQDEVLPLARKMPGYAGMYQDQARGGRIVLRFTSVSTESRAALADVTAGSGVEVMEGASATFDELDAALTAAWKKFPAVVPNGRLITVAVDEVSSQLVLGVSADTFSTARQSLNNLRLTLGVPVSIEVASETVLQAQTCTSRTRCYDPMEAGAYLRNNGANVWQECTMGFHVYAGSGYGFVLAGHCSYGANGDSWYMEDWPAPSGGLIGSVRTSAYKDLGQDFMVVTMNSSAQRSNMIYGSTRRVQGRANPVAGETICASLGATNTVDCGTVRTVNLSWLDDHNFIIRGADHDSITTHLGDSGAPLYRLSGTSYAVATGIHNTTQGYFAKMADGLAATGASIYP